MTVKKRQIFINIYVIREKIKNKIFINEYLNKVVEVNSKNNEAAYS
jgi:hypothetical protein